MSVTLGTPFSNTATKILLCGSGELGKEVAIEAQRLGCEVIALDRYENAPAMQVADRSYTVSMLDGPALKAIIEAEKPDYIVPEIEAIATDILLELESEGFNVVPSANAAHLTMNREGIRTLVAETLGLPTSTYAFAVDKMTFITAVNAIGFPCIVGLGYTNPFRHQLRFRRFISQFTCVQLPKPHVTVDLRLFLNRSPPRC